MKLIFLFFISIFLVSGTACSSQLINVKLQVLDDNTHPVSNAKVDIGFLLSHGGNRFSGLTDSNGYIEASEYGVFGQKIHISKDAYYDTKTRTGYGDQNLTLLLRKKKNPIAMYAKHFKEKIPVNDKKVGFDFIGGDWVSPYGNGKYNHIYFKYTGNSTDFFNYKAKLIISFPNEKDGYQSVEYPQGAFSEFHLPYEAPLTNYLSILERDTWSKKATDEKNYKYQIPFINNDDFGYFFRVNTLLDVKGEIVNANYVKIRKDIVFSPSRKTDYNPVASAGYIDFIYYYNPISNDRNVEFDPERNLLSNLKPEERVREP